MLRHESRTIERKQKATVARLNRHIEILYAIVRAFFTLYALPVTQPTVSLSKH